MNKVLKEGLTPSDEMPAAPIHCVKIDGTGDGILEQPVLRGRNISPACREEDDEHQEYEATAAT